MNKLKYFSTPVCLILILISFLSVIVGKSYTHWDTFDVITTNFIYLSDSLKSGILAFWNPFVLSGTPLLASSFFTNSLYSPIDLCLLLLSLFISPVYLAEVNIIIGAFLFFYGSKLLFQNLNFSKNISNYIGLMSTLVMIPPVVGQISFIYSLALLVWLTYFNLDQQRKTFFKVLLQACIIASLTVKGYFYYITIFFLFNLVVALYFTKKNKKSFQFFLLQKMPLFLIPTIFFLILNLEGTLDFIKQYSELTGDLIIKEPRLRQLSGNVTHGLSLSSILKSFFSFRESTWGALNFSYYSLIVLPLTLISLRRINKEKKTILFLIISIIVSMLFSSNEKMILAFTSRIPIISSFRWVFYNLHIAIFLTIILSSYGLKELLSCLSKKKEAIASFIILITITSITLKLGIQRESNGGRKSIQDFPKELKHRLKASPVLSENSRVLNNAPEFEYNDYSWLSKKIPISHGYNNTISEYYWRMKDMPFNSKIVRFSCNINLESNIQRKDFKSDNDFVDAKISQINPSKESFLTNNESSITKCAESNYKISNFSLSPNSLLFTIETMSKGMIIINQNNKSGWSALVDGKESKIYKMNHIFQGLLLNTPGKYVIKLTYLPKTGVILIVFYLSILSLLHFYQKKSNF
ncbi:hypothetical protein [Halobacteriovorax sp. JY17]|uniref:hypothetical protein n=1 Tax=Halobacteriovorax sp. JY17 TaxID=2014617 RepID=UPI000C36A7DF|nr:hypothetical protein [Halobacteriovorax sp. JY17]PIK14711.1 MAG: hypothetical protein CES88_10255 [Halobacteriovorax sp. JY17]